MPAFVRHLARLLLQASRQIPAKRKCNPPWQCSSAQCRNFTSTRPRLADDTEEKLLKRSAKRATKKEEQALTEFTVADFSPEERADYEQLPKQEQQDELQRINETLNALHDGEFDDEMDGEINGIQRDLERETEPLRFIDHRARGQEVGFWAEDEDDEFGQVEDGDDDVVEEDITSMAHADLELHREMREYTRIIAWDMPLLSKFSKPFKTPPLTSPLRFRYTTYMGETHPAARKVVLHFCTRDLPSLTEPQRIKLIKLVGVRYNPDTDVVHMSCEKFEHPAQNKRYLGDLVATLIKEAKNEKDMFEDVPLDFRHHEPKRTLVYPEAWKLGGEKEGNVKRLVEFREEVRLLEEGVPVDGKKAVEEYVRVGVLGRGGGFLSEAPPPPRRQTLR